MKLTFENWYKSRFGHDFGGVSDEDCDLESCWQAAADTTIAAAVEAEREACAAMLDGREKKATNINAKLMFSICAKAIRARGKS